MTNILYSPFHQVLSRVTGIFILEIKGHLWKWKVSASERVCRILLKYVAAKIPLSLPFLKNNLSY